MTILKGVSVKMSGFVSALSVFPTSCNTFYTDSLSLKLQSLSESSKLGYYPKLSAETVDLSSWDEKKNKAKPDNFTETPFNKLLIGDCYPQVFDSWIQI